MPCQTHMHQSAVETIRWQLLIRRNRNLFRLHHAGESKFHPFCYRNPNFLLKLTLRSMSSSSQRRDVPSTGFVLRDVWDAYNIVVPTPLKKIDAFLAYVLLTGITQFVYALYVGSFPFNSFLAGFLSCVGVFVLTVSLRMQIDPRVRADPSNRWSHLTVRRAYVDWLFCNLILHMTVLNFVG